MAKSKYEYVRNFEIEDRLLPSTWLVARIDGQGFTKFTAQHGFEKPNDVRALNLMNRAATMVLESMQEIVLGYGQSDEYSFVFSRDAKAYGRRASKLSTLLVSRFTSAYVFYWNEFFPDTPLKCLPAFDSRIVVYPSDRILRDYLCWRQVDCHINNMYNTCFWALVNKGGLSQKEAEKRLSGTLSSDKNELLFSEFKLNYNNEAEIFKRGSVLIRDKRIVDVPGPDGVPAKRTKTFVSTLHCDIVKNKFWEQHPDILADKPTRAERKELLQAQREAELCAESAGI
ncbi:tRNA-histidine guanylyltransferase 1-like [Coemansia sp. RSA 2399]|nr:tRNA-histidine guanylyltransferase 1-like [Coemansia sp. RSA 2399]KAJ1905986.1 tRNA-histidine guanylyltransferase 1-like [Coemansia sp. IMI 209127]